MSVKKRIIYGVEVFLDDDGRWKDITGTVWGFPDDTASVDKVVRLGVGWLSLPMDHPLTRAAIAHDAAFSNPEYQRNHTRSEVDREFLRQALELAGDDFTLRTQAYAFFGIVRLCGHGWWECRATRWK